MSKWFSLAGIFTLALVLTGCGGTSENFYTSPQYKQKVEAQFEIQKKLAKHRAGKLFNVLESKDIPQVQEDALVFLFAHMPLSDLADYDGDFFLENVRIAFQARQTLPWGNKVPMDVFRHFVLPYRINNENLDHFRTQYFKELKKRVEKLSMREAVLEINHWCHEKVAYRGTDIRTSAPCSTIRTAYGRCGEESTFTVSALRMMGIPARQCYTPRWAHCDDNHAWVETWVDGKWYYLGACEPEPRLNMAWFTEPARRAMLVHTKVFGRYEGPEEVVAKTSRYTEINVIQHYTDTRHLEVTVLDKDKKPVSGATVQFRLYNYAEFYPLAEKTTGSQGVCSLTTGKGDLVIWALKENAFGFIKAGGKADRVQVILDKNKDEEYALKLDLTPPVSPEPYLVDEKGKEKNDKRLAREDEIRAAYEATFMNREKAAALASRIGLEPAEVWNVLEKSRGNWEAISRVLQVPDSTLKPWVLPLLNAVSEKDLRDTPADILLKQLAHSFVYPGGLPFEHKDIFIPNVLNPRVDNEIISPYKSFLQSKFEKPFIEKTRGDVNHIVKWIDENITIHDTANYYRVPITPIGVYRLRAADYPSRDIFFVALCRSFGIPARLEPAVKVPQYYDITGGQWKTVVFADHGKTAIQEKQTGEKAFLTFIAHADETGLVPLYYTHFTLSRFSGGQYRTLEYPYDQKVPDFPANMEIDPGHYLLITGNRLKDGGVACNLRFFNAAANSSLKLPVELRKAEGKTLYYGKMNLEATVKELDGGAEKQLSDYSGEKGLIIGWLEPDREPTKHVMRDLRKHKESFDRWGGTFIFFIMPEKMTASLGKNYFKGLPSRYIVARDTPDGHFQNLQKTVKRTFGNRFPVFITVDPKGGIDLLVNGYRIGIGELLLKTVL